LINDSRTKISYSLIDAAVQYTPIDYLLLDYLYLLLIPIYVGNEGWIYIQQQQQQQQQQQL